MKTWNYIEEPEKEDEKGGSQVTLKQEKKKKGRSQKKRKKLSSKNKYAYRHQKGKHGLSLNHTEENGIKVNYNR